MTEPAVRIDAPAATGLRVGTAAPAFRLPSADGREVGLEDYRGKETVIVWFTKGMVCPFCRQKMSQLAKAYPEMRKRGAGLLEISNSTTSRARFYGENFRLPFPYLADPDWAVRRLYGLDVRSHSLGWYVQSWLMRAKMGKAGRVRLCSSRGRK